MAGEEVDSEKSEANRSDQANGAAAEGERFDSPGDGGSQGCLGAKLLERLDRLTRLFEDKLAYDQFKEVQITRLHAELQDYRSDLLARAVLPLINGTIRLHDDLGKVIEAAQRSDWARIEPSRLLRALETFHEDFEELLADHGVTTYRSPQEAFDPHRQRALRTIRTTEAQLVGRVAERLQPGFERNGSVVTKERVAVYVAAPPDETSAHAVARCDPPQRQPDQNAVKAITPDEPQTPES
jgi:molecular chaperone GrpE